VIGRCSGRTLSTKSLLETVQLETGADVRIRESEANGEKALRSDPMEGQTSCISPIPPLNSELTTKLRIRLFCPVLDFLKLEESRK
jgi:hypothetical protein